MMFPLTGSSLLSSYLYSLYKVTSTQTKARSYISSYKYLKLKFEREDGGYYSARGFVVGYIQYGKQNTQIIL